MVNQPYGAATALDASASHRWFISDLAGSVTQQSKSIV